jgi:hypothetical protein
MKVICLLKQAEPETIAQQIKTLSRYFGSDPTTGAGWDTQGVVSFQSEDLDLILGVDDFEFVSFSYTRHSYQSKIGAILTMNAIQHHLKSWQTWPDVENGNAD